MRVREPLKVLTYAKLKECVSSFLFSTLTLFRSLYRLIPEHNLGSTAVPFKREILKACCDYDPVLFHYINQPEKVLIVCVI